MRRLSASCVTVALFTVVFSCSPGPRADTGEAELDGVPGALLTPRRLLPFVQLEDGRVLAAGGHDGHRTLTACEVFEPETGEWHATGALHTGRRNHATVRLADGRVLVVGGTNGLAMGALASAEVFTPATGTWAEVSPMHEPRNDPAMVLLADGRVLVAGGTDVDRRVLRSAELFDPTTGTWSPAEPPAFARGGARTAVLLRDGRALFASGLQSELYDATTGHWEKAGLVGGAAGTHRLGHTVTLLPDGRVLVVGGITQRAAETAEVFSPVTGAWTLLPSPMVPRDHHTTVVTSEGAVLVMGGEHYTTGALASVERFEPTTDTWSSSPALHDAREGATALLLPDETVVLAGGWNELGTLALSEAYVPDSCVPATCATRVGTCGAVQDGCGRVLDCGPCTVPERSGP
ncbi:galactose oxidase [Myxococcaceae bacterium JPH2]|nr:galactose oxidase [Myxococcaceae bacterium JPH2]